MLNVHDVGVYLLGQIFAIMVVNPYAGKHVLRRLVNRAHQADLDNLLYVVGLIDRKHVHPDPERLLKAM